MVALVSALLGSTAYDGFSNSSSWIGWAQNTNYSMTLLGTIALAGFIVFVFSTYSTAALLAGRLSDSTRPSSRGCSPTRWSRSRWATSSLTTPRC